LQWQFIFLSSYPGIIKEFDGAYSKLEKTTLIRNDSGELEFHDASTVVTRVIWYIIPIGLTVIGAVFWLVS
jgi:hypothetical protein